MNQRATSAFCCVFKMKNAESSKSLNANFFPLFLQISWSSKRRTQRHLAASLSTVRWPLLRRHRSRPRRSTEQRPVLHNINIYIHKSEEIYIYLNLNLNHNNTNKWKPIPAGSSSRPCASSSSSSSRNQQLTKGRRRKIKQICREKLNFFFFIFFFKKKGPKGWLNHFHMQIS